MVSGATLKSRNQKQTPSLSSRSQPRNCDVRPVSVPRAGTGRHQVGLTWTAAPTGRSGKLQSDTERALPPVAAQLPTIQHRLRSEKSY